MEKRKWHCQMRLNGSINMVETDLIGLQRIVFNLRYISEKDALKISVAREMFDFLKEISDCIDNNFSDAGEFQCEMIFIQERIAPILETVNQEIK